MPSRVAATVRAPWRAGACGAADGRARGALLEAGPRRPGLTRGVNDESMPMDQKVDPSATAPQAAQEHVELSTRGEPWRRRQRSWRTYVATLAGLAALGTGGWWLHRQFTHVVVTDARVAADMVVVSSRLPGRVLAIEVREGDPVSKGAVLVRVDDRESRAQALELQAQLAGVPLRREEIEARITLSDRQTSSEIAVQKANVRAAEAALAAATAQRDLASAEHERIVDLVRQGMVTQSRRDQTLAALETARHGVSSAEASLQKARASVAQAQAARETLNVLNRQRAELGPEEARLRAARSRVQLDVEDRVVTMPFDGVVNRLFVDKDEYVAAGQRLLMLHDPARVRVEANVKETDIRFFRPGKTVSISVDALPGRTFEGTIERVGQAATSEFALLPNPNPSGNFTKITQRLPVRVSVRQVDGMLKPGMMVEIEVATND
ncbi:MAG: HlyD family secretion protein [Burkholderiaceae bacterium]|nr:HlyD family secretion protein [Burkholderiaceae bacterium]